MPESNGMGPQGNDPIIGRGLGRCRRAPLPAQEPSTTAQRTQEDNRAAMSQGSAQNIPVYGRGRGSVPCGCGRGHGFGGGRRLKE